MKTKTTIERILVMLVSEYYNKIRKPKVVHLHNFKKVGFDLIKNSRSLTCEGMMIKNKPVAGIHTTAIKKHNFKYKKNYLCVFFKKIKN